MKKSGVRNYTPITEDGSLGSFLSTPNDAQAHGVPRPQHRGQSSYPYYESNGGDGIAALDRRPRAVKPNLEGLGDDNVNIAARTNSVFIDPRCADMGQELPGEDDDDGLGDKYGVGIEGDDGDGEGDGEGDDEGVCQPGQEQTGRWTRKEHELFLDALKKYGKEWKKVASAVKTRTVVQTRTHAQKYFQKISKVGGGNIIGGAASTREGTVLGNFAMYSDDDGTFDSGSSKRTSGRRTRRSYDTGSGSGNGSAPRRMMSTLRDGDLREYQHDAEYDELGLLVPLTATPMAKPISISVGRLPEDFPQPSPAACGKRKIAELTAAQMLTASSGRMGQRDDFDGAQVLSALKGAAVRPGVIDKRSGQNASFPVLSIINPDSLESGLGVADSYPGTPWDREVGALDARERRLAFSPRATGLSTPSEQRDFLGKVMSYVKSADLVELRQILEAVEVSSASLLGASMATALDLQEDTVSAAFGAVDGIEGGDNSSGNTSSGANLGSSSGIKGNLSSTTGARAGAGAGAGAGSTVVARILNRMGPQGTTCLMEACSLNSQEHDQSLVLSICKVLLEHGASAFVLDSTRASCLHKLAKSGFEKVGRLLLNKGCPVNAIDLTGCTALHVAMQAGHVHFLELLAEFGVNCHVRNLQSRSALDLAGTSPGTIHLRAELRRVMMTVEPRLRTLVLYHGDCLEHATRKVADWEGPDRLVGIMNRLQDRLEFPEHELEVSSQFDKAAVELLSRVHSPEYIAFVDKLSKKLVMESEGESREIKPVAFTPHVQRAMAMSNTSEVKFTEHSDTAFSAGTLRAARRAAGAVAHAVDRVLLGRNKNAFCVVRPPGHHAGYRGLLDGAKSCGFCIFNSVAAGAVHALEGHNCERVAIVDLDIHHGNGTEDIVRRYPNPSRILFFSLHLYDKESVPGYEFFPGSGALDDTVHNIINVPIMPIWHIQQKDTAKRPLGPKALVGREAYRQAITQRLLPSLRAFNPDLILLSTGFDPVEGDVGNTRSGTADGEAGMDLQPKDFEWVTSEILKIADICCSGRVVSVLEGGYGQFSELEGNDSRGFAYNQEMMNRDILSSAASAHVRCLIDPYSAPPEGSSPS